MNSPEILHYTAFTDRPDGGNPAGVVLDARGLDEPAMQAIAATLGYSESAFLFPRGGSSYDIRYFSPIAEIPFCGHATIATAVALAERKGAGALTFHAPVGEVPVETRVDADRVLATLTSVAPYVEAVPDDVVDAALQALRWSADDLDPQLPPRIAFAGNRELVIAVRTRERLRALDYDFPALQQLLAAIDAPGAELVWRESATVFHARSPFPFGGVVEDPATGAAAAAFGAYLRELNLIATPATVTIHQGVDMGRPSLLTVDIGREGGIRVTGQAVALAHRG